MKKTKNNYIVGAITPEEFNTLLNTGVECTTYYHVDKKMNLGLYPQNMHKRVIGANVFVSFVEAIENIEEGLFKTHDAHRIVIVSKHKDLLNNIINDYKTSKAGVKVEIIENKNNLKIF